MRSAKKMRDSFIMTFSTTNMAPKKRMESRYKRSRIQNIGAEKATYVSIAEYDRSGQNLPKKL